MLWLVIAAVLLVLAETHKLHGAPEEVAVENALINEVAHYAVENHPGDTLEDGYFDALESIISAENQVIKVDIKLRKILVTRLEKNFFFSEKLVSGEKRLKCRRPQ